MTFDEQVDKFTSLLADTLKRRTRITVTASISSIRSTA